MNKEQIKELYKKGKLWDYIILNELGKQHTGNIKAREVLFLCAVGRLLKNRKPYSFNCLLLTYNQTTRPINPTITIAINKNNNPFPTAPIEKLATGFKSDASTIYASKGSI